MSLCYKAGERYRVRPPEATDAACALQRSWHTELNWNKCVRLNILGNAVFLY